MNRDIGNHHSLKDMDQNLDNSNLKGKTDLNCLNFLFMMEVENKELRQNYPEFEEFESFISKWKSTKPHFFLSKYS